MSAPYFVHIKEKNFKLAAPWHHAQWQKAPIAVLDYHMGAKPVHFPKVQARLLYDQAHLYIIFKCQDRYIKAVSTQYHGPVWEDSCVEFFFTPSNDIAKGYFNLEINCIGNLLMCHQVTRGNQVVPLPCQLLDQIEVISTLGSKAMIDEIKEPTTWELACKIPFAILGDYHDVVTPKPDTMWQFNLQKCADNSSGPHWLTHHKIDVPEPDFHRPEFFGSLVFC